MDCRGRLEIANRGSLFLFMNRPHTAECFCRELDQAPPEIDAIENRGRARGRCFSEVREHGARGCVKRDRTSVLQMLRTAFAVRGELRLTQRRLRAARGGESCKSK